MTIVIAVIIEAIGYIGLLGNVFEIIVSVIYFVIAISGFGGMMRVIFTPKMKSKKLENTVKEENNIAKETINNETNEEMIKQEVRDEIEEDMKELKSEREAEKKIEEKASSVNNISALSSKEKNEESKPDEIKEQKEDNEESKENKE